jgi:hypothetical protein
MLTRNKVKRRSAPLKPTDFIREIKCDFKDQVAQLKKDWLALINQSYLAKDPQFLRKMAINIKHLHHDAKRMKKTGALRSQALQIQHFLSTPIGAPFVAKETLVKAAYLFSEQDPQDSDLSAILREFSLYGKSFPMQLLSLFN